MPVIHVYTFQGKSVAQKRNIVAGITQAMVDGAGTEAKEVHVLIHDMPISDWSNGGVLYSENQDYLEKRKRTKIQNRRITPRSGRGRRTRPSRRILEQVQGRQSGEHRGER